VLSPAADGDVAVDLHYLAARADRRAADYLSCTASRRSMLSFGF